MIDRDTIDRIYAAANIVDIIGDYVTLKRKGVNYQACCPFHNEKTPSFVVSPSKGLFKCFGCGKGGNAVTFIMEIDGLSYPEALKVVAKRYNIEVVEEALTQEQVRANDNRESMITLNSWAGEYMSNYLHRSDEGQSVGLSYFRQQRGFSDATIKRFELGFCPSRGNTMSLDALGAGYKSEFLLSTGLSLQRESDGSLYDRFRDRVIFPIHNISGRIVAFGGRTLRSDKKVAKYQNSPESELYSKRRELYGLYFAKKAIQQDDYVIMVEGYTDVISMNQSGIENVVSSSGTSLTIEQIRLLARFTKNITIIYDGDAAGIGAALRGIDLVLSEGLNVRVVLLPDGEDPDSFARSNSAEAFKDYILNNEQDFLTFKAKLLLRDAGRDPVKKAGVITDMVQSITQIPDQIKRTIFIKECAMIMDIDEGVLFSEVARKRATSSGDVQTEEFIRRQQKIQPSTQINQQSRANLSLEAGSGVTALELELVKYLLKSGHETIEFREGSRMIACNVASLIFTELDDAQITFSDPIYNTILEIYRREWAVTGEGEAISMNHFLESNNAEVCNRTVDILTWDDNYVPSQIWERKEVHVESDNERISAGVPKAVMLYKFKVLESTIKQFHARLSAADITEDEESEVIRRVAQLNKSKVLIANKLQRLII
ncbi:MAG: DNA primase [Rikenellaceae bacterium]